VYQPGDSSRLRHDRVLGGDRPQRGEHLGLAAGRGQVERTVGADRGGDGRIDERVERVVAELLEHRGGVARPRADVPVGEVTRGVGAVGQLVGAEVRHGRLVERCCLVERCGLVELGHVGLRESSGGHRDGRVASPFCHPPARGQAT
jgi:hypothetical protein